MQHSWCYCRQSASQPAALVKTQAVAHQLLSTCRYSHMTGNFLAAIASHHSLLSNQVDIKQWLLEAMQWAKASEVQRKDMQVRWTCSYSSRVLQGSWLHQGLRRLPGGAGPRHLQIA